MSITDERTTNRHACYEFLVMMMMVVAKTRGRRKEQKAQRKKARETYCGEEQASMQMGEGRCWDWFNASLCVYMAQHNQCIIFLTYCFQFNY